jgi:hypothetical protein
VGELSDMERDAQHAAEALARLAAYVRLRGDERDTPARQLAEDGAVAAERVLAYLRDLRGWGDGVATAYPQQLGPWRHWSPQRGYLLEAPDRRARSPRHGGDPGE